MGKSIEAAARACWLNQRGIPWQGFDLDGDNRTLSRLFPAQVKLTPLAGRLKTWTNSFDFAEDHGQPSR